MYEIEIGICVYEKSVTISGTASTISSKLDFELDTHCSQPVASRSSCGIAAAIADGLSTTQYVTSAVCTLRKGGSGGQRAAPLAPR